MIEFFPLSNTQTVEHTDTHTDTHTHRHTHTRILQALSSPRRPAAAKLPSAPLERDMRSRGRPPCCPAPAPAESLDAEATAGRKTRQRARHHARGRWWR